MKHSIQMIPVIGLLLSVVLSWWILANGDQSAQTERSPTVSAAASSSADPSEVSSASGTAVPAAVGLTLFEDSSFRAVWIPYFDLDMSGAGGQHFGAFQAKYDKMLQTAAENGINTVIVHVHAFGDAMYRSAYFPWSHLLTGTQGADPGYDAMSYMVEAAHQAGLSFHAWINPLRVATSYTPSALAASNPVQKWWNDEDSGNDSWAVRTDTGVFLNPGYAEVRTYVTDWVTELVTKYAVDAVHMDDYFYPTTEASFDEAAYHNYCLSAGENAMTLLAWRTENINLLVSGLYSAVHAARPAAQFGISPQGNIDNCAKAGADVKKWASTPGYVDYLCPQIYYNAVNPSRPFEQTAAEWYDLTTCKQVTLYAGLALYKAGDSAVDGGTWTAADDQIRSQLTFLSHCGYAGFALYAYDYLFSEQTAAEMQNVRECLGVLQPASAASE